MNDFNASDKIVLAVLVYLVLVSVMQFVFMMINPSLDTVEHGKNFSGFVEFVIGAVVGYVGGRGES